MWHIILPITGIYHFHIERIALQKSISFSCYSIQLHQITKKSYSSARILSKKYPSTYMCSKKSRLEAYQENRLGIRIKRDLNRGLYLERRGPNATHVDN